jgi:acyl-CoA reductase-like NAD-dependent aldehyde dehydrogenase
MTTQDIITQLRTLHGYTRLDAERAVRDVLDVVRFTLDELQADESLTLPGIGRWLCRVMAKPHGAHGLEIAWNNSRQIRLGMAARTLPADDPRVVKALKKKHQSWRPWSQGWCPGE